MWTFPCAHRGAPGPATVEGRVRETGLRYRWLGLGLLLLAAAAGFFWVSRRAGALRPDVQADRIVVEKGARRLTIYREGAPLKTYHVALGRDPVGPKQVEGDGRTPEGLYTIDWRKLDSDYHRALHVSYPNRDDVERARARGEPPGGSIMVHGLPNGLGWIGPAHRATDWTDGCIAVTDEEIEELWAAVPDGTPIEIHP